jgi:hypothetical protein
MIAVKITKDGISGISRSEMRKVGRAAIAASAYHWWKNFLPIHFTKKAAKRYNYAERQGEFGMWKGSYSWMKLHKKEIAGVAAIGEVKPMVWSGRSRESATSTQKITTKAPNYATYEGRAVINARALAFIAKKGMGYQEVIRTTPQEDGALASVFMRAFEEELNKRGRTRRTTTTIKAA